MRNYVIINGVNSLTKNGLAIKDLPPITKTMMRTLREEIDGRDGDIITELGYSAYDKSMTIGLFGTGYDIDDIIAFFNQSGTIVFSNEPDKFYNFKIIDQIDYNKLLKFKEATIRFHCQPFKYPVTETPLEEEYEYVTGTGTNITLDNTSEAIFNKIDLLGNTEQTQYTGINQLGIKDKAQTTTNGLTYKVENGVMILNGTTTSAVNLSLLTEEYSITQGTHNCFCSRTGTSRFDVYLRDTNNVSKVTLGNVFQQAGISNRNFTAGETFTLGYTTIYIPNGTTFSNEEIRLMITNSATQTYEPYVGGIPSPNPNYPQDIHVVSGDNTIDICGKNLAQNIKGYVGATYTSGNGECFVFYGNTNQTYRWNCSATTNRTVLAYSGDFPTSGISVERLNEWGKGSTFTATKDGWYIFYVNNALDETIKESFIINKGTTQLPYEPYQGASYSVNLGSLELCKLGDYQDYIYKDNGSWYLHKEIGKYIFDSTWSYSQTNNTFQIPSEIVNAMVRPRYTTDLPMVYCNYLSPVTWASSWATLQSFIAVDTTQVQARVRMSLPNMSLQEFQTWLTTHEMYMLYPLATPTNTEITDTTLIEQLEALKLATSYEGQTNISQDNNDLPFILDVSALELNSDHLVINNIGNIYSKPTLDLEGTGIVDIYLNDIQMFEVDLTENNEIIINTEEMEAFNPETGALANRQVTGEYDVFKLDPGENDLRFSGNLTKATITNYERWL